MTSDLRGPFSRKITKDTSKYLFYKLHITSKFPLTFYTECFWLMIFKVIVNLYSPIPKASVVFVSLEKNTSNIVVYHAKPLYLSSKYQNDWAKRCFSPNFKWIYLSVLNVLKCCFLHLLIVWLRLIIMKIFMFNSLNDGN